jgi:hypothetical protein
MRKISLYVAGALAALTVAFVALTGGMAGAGTTGGPSTTLAPPKPSVTTPKATAKPLPSPTISCAPGQVVYTDSGEWGCQDAPSPSVKP